VKSVKCLECDCEISPPEDAIDGEIVTCPDCGTSFELRRSGGEFTLQPAQIEGEDWGE